jgi:hypothetical protein
MRVLARVLVPMKFGLDLNSPISFTIDGEKIFILGEIYEGIKVHSYLGKDLDWVNNSKKGRESRMMKTKLETGESIPTRTVIMNSGSEDYLEGTVDLLISTIFDIYFEFPDNDFAHDETTQNKVNEKAIHILRFFINTYRSLTMEADIHNPSALDLPVFELAYSKNHYTSEKDILGGEYIFLGRTLNWFSPLATGYFKKNIPGDVFKEFQLNLNSNEQVPIHLQLLADAREHAIIRKDYKVSIILSATATEVYLQNRLITECIIRKVTTLTTGRGKGKSSKNFIDAVLNGNIREDLIGDICKELTTKNIKESNFYTDWYNSSYDLRNQIIHQGKIINTEEEAKRAFISVINLINHINDLLVKGR